VTADDARTRAFNIGMQAVLRAYKDGVGDSHGGDEEFVAYVVIAVEPIIRADERERNGWGRHEEIEADLRERIAQEIEAMHSIWADGATRVSRAEVLRIARGGAAQ
jgi:hypothetical protein